MAAFAFATRLSVSIHRWALIGISNRKMRRLWKAFLEAPEKWWSRDELGEFTRLGVGSFEAELVELDMAGLIEPQKRFAGQYVHCLTEKGKQVLHENNPDTYQWKHPSWKKAAPDLLEGQANALRELTKVMLALAVLFGIAAVSASGTLNSILGFFEGSWIFLSGLVYWWQFKLSTQRDDKKPLYRNIAAITTLCGLFLIAITIGSWT